MIVRNVPPGLYGIRGVMSVCHLLVDGPDAVDRITDYNVKNRTKGEAFLAIVKRVGKGPIRDLLETMNQQQFQMMQNMFINQHNQLSFFKNAFFPGPVFLLGNVGTLCINNKLVII